jgi:hypothetical protein
MLVELFLCMVFKIKYFVILIMDPELKEETLESVLQKIYTRLSHIEAVLGYVLTVVNDPKIESDVLVNEVGISGGITPKEV